MQTFDFNTLLNTNTYPGRGICLGIDETGENAVIVYFIMGRSVNSRNRIFEESEDGIITKAYDESLMTDPHLIIYAPVRDMGDGRVIVTNGDQTDTVRDFLKEGSTFEAALRTRTFEDDLPNCTPRISGIVEVKDGAAMYKLSILKSDEHDDSSVQRFFYEYPQPKAGVGHFIHTYKCDGNPIPSFVGEPEKVVLPNTAKELCDVVWSNLNEDNKVSLFVRCVNLETKEAEEIIVNKNK